MMKKNVRNWLALFVLCSSCAGSLADAAEVLITKYGAVGDAQTLNTKAIQSAVDQVASNGVGTVVVPKGIFVSGALFLKPGVNLRIEKGGVIRCSIDMANFPEQRTRIEGHFEEQFNSALINADGCNGLEISGEGTLDGAGKPIWDLFWKLQAGNTEFKNLDVPRARLCIIENSKNVTVKGITFKDAQFWNLHLYKCRSVTVEDARFVVPDNDKPPSSDGIDVDSCQEVTVKRCYFSVNDDCIALKGTKGPFAMKDKTSPPVEHIRVSDCIFMRGHGVVTCGSEATTVRDVIVKDCVVKGGMPLVRLKLRPDTPQQYEDFLFENIIMDSDKATLLEIKKWTQYFDLMGQPEPASIVRNIKISNVRGSIGSLGEIQGNKMTEISDITLEAVDVKTNVAAFDVSNGVKDLQLNGVVVNGKPLTVKHILSGPGRLQNQGVYSGKPIKIVLVGDSTMCEYDLNRPECGWGMFFSEAFEPGSVDVHNLARSGRSTKTFIEEKRWDAALALKPDVVFIQFGHNDSHAPEKPESTDATTDYRDYLRRYIDDCRAIGTTPILVTAMVHRTFNEGGTLDDNLAPYAEAMQAVAAEKGVAVIDLHAMSRKFFEPLGPDEAQRYASKLSDRTHFNEAGARAITGLVIQGLAESDVPLKKHLGSASRTE